LTKGRPRQNLFEADSPESTHSLYEDGSEFLREPGTCTSAQSQAICRIYLGVDQLCWGRKHQSCQTALVRFTMKFSAITVLVIARIVAADPVTFEKRQSCPKVYTFGARETTVSPGYGTAGGLVNQIKSAFPGSGSEPIVYPACGGQPKCGGASYDSSQMQGTAAVVNAVTAYNKKCPNTQIILVGYSQVRLKTTKRASRRVYSQQGWSNHG
jgi:cutinase